MFRMHYRELTSLSTVIRKRNLFLSLTVCEVIKKANASIKTFGCS